MDHCDARVVGRPRPVQSAGYRAQVRSICVHHVQGAAATSAGSDQMRVP